MMNRWSVALLLAMTASQAHATGATLTARPNPATQAACSAWAKHQDQEALNMWGQSLDGTSDVDVALQRLTASCLGKKPPDIVNFGSSESFDEAFCRRQKDAAICETN